MKVFLRPGSHSLYRSFIDFPPENVTFTTPKTTLPSKNSVVQKLKVKAYFSFLDAFAKPNIIAVDEGDAELIHSGGGFFLKNQKNWVAGPIEHVGDFLGNRPGWISKVRNKRYQKNIAKEVENKYCKKLMNYSYVGMRTITRILPERLHEKLEVVRLAFGVPEPFKREKSDRIKFLFLSSINFPANFEVKGGKETLEAFNMISDNYDCELIVRSLVPEYIKKRYAKNDKIQFIEHELSWTELQELYKQSNVFIHPSYVTPGSVFLEAMGYSLPIITTDVWANSEMVEDGVNGFVVQKPKASFYDDENLPVFYDWNKLSEHIRTTDTTNTSDELAQKMKQILEETKLIEKFGLSGRKMVEDGEFSIKERNKKLKRIYEDSLQS